MNKRIKKIFMRFLTTVISVCTLMNNLSFPIKSEAIETKYQFCYVHFNTDDSSVDKYAKILKSGNIVYINLEDFLSLTNMVTLHNSQINFAVLPDEIRKNTSKIDDVFFLTKKNVNLTWVFSNGSSNAYCVSQYEGITSTELGGEVVFLGESNAEKYIPFQTLLSIFNIQYVINESSIEILDGYYTSKDYFHMEFLKNYQTNNLNVLHSVYGVAGKFFDIYGRRLDDYANFNFKDLENLSSEIIGNTVNENDFKKLTALYCLPNQTENDKLTDVSQLTYNSALPLLHSIASKHNGKKVDNSESALKFFNDFCDSNEYLEVNGNRVSTDTLKTVFGSNLNGNVSKYESINDNLDSLGKSFTIASKFLETSIDLVSISDEISKSNDEMVNSLDLYCDYHLKTNVENNFNNFDNIAMSNGITSDGIEIFKKYMDIYKNDSSQIQYCVDTVAKGIYETYENIGWDVVIDTLATADPTGTFKIIKTVKFGLGVANSIYSLTTWLMNDTTGVFDKFEASKLSLYLYSMEKDSNQLINDLKENFSEYYSENNSFYSDYAQLEYIRLKSFYLSNLANAEIYKNEIKELQADTSADHSKEIKFYQEKMALSEKNAEEICQLMISVLKSKNQLTITTIYSETADAELLSSNAIYQTINGTVQDSSGNIVNNVAVTFKSATEEHTINSDEFPVYLKPNDYDIIISDSRYNQYTSKITLNEFGAVSVEIVLEENSENLYYKFIEEELIPKYGVSELKKLTIDYTLSVDHNANSPDYSDWYGVISADICDINGKQNLLTVALKEINRKPHLIFELYGYDENVHLIDTYDLEMNEYTTGFNVGWSDGYLCSSYSWHYNYISSRYGSIDTLLKVNANGFTQCFELWNSYSMGGAMRLYNAVSEKIYFDTDGSSMDGITESIEVIKNDLSSLGISKYEIGCEDYSESFVFNIIFTNEICDFNIYEEYGEPQDYTDLRSHITVKETENQTWQQLYL